MNAYDFLKHILPTSGIYCLTLIKQGLINQRFIDFIPSDKDINDTATHYPGYDIYYAVASFNSPGSRTQTNVAYLKSLWIDLDVGPGSAYATKPKARTALKQFLNDANLPVPTLVDSGGGYHVYWPLTHNININEWKPLAVALIAKAKEHGFNIKDPGITTDAARILRIPGTHNYKTQSAPLVTCFPAGVVSDPGQLYDLLDAGAVIIPQPKVIPSNLTLKSSPVSALTRSLMNYKGQQYGEIIKRSMEGRGCIQLANGYLNQESLSGMHWWGVMSIPQFTEQRVEAVHNISYQHSNYSMAATEAKVGRADGPYSCIKINGHQPELCASCSHYGNITYPFLLDRTPRSEQQLNPLAEELVSLGLPPTIYPYLIGAKAGVFVKEYIKNKDDDGGMLAIKHVYNHSFYVSGRHVDPHDGELVELRLIRPHDGVTEFTVPLSDITAKEKCREHLSKKGIAADQFKMGRLMQYTTEFCNYLQSVKKAEKIRTQFGWHDNDTCFVVGDREIYKDGIRYAMPSKDTQQVATYFTKEGTLEAWQSVAQLYAAPNNEVRAFSLLLGFGCPMFKFLGEGGTILHLVNRLSGVGKSAAQGLGLSVWGHPKEGMSKMDDTLNSRMHRLGVMNNVLFCMDEITKMTHDEVGTLAYSISQGKGKARMESSANRERINLTRWSVPCITSGNASIHGILQANSMSPDGEIMRVLEMRVDPIVGITKEESDRLFIEVLQHNYGHAGEPVIEYILHNKEECYKRLKTIQVQFDLVMGYGNPERFYSLLTTTALWGGEIANLLGIVAIPLAPIVDFLLTHNGNTRQEARTAIQLSGGDIGAFINEHSGNHALVLDARPSNIPGDLRVPMQTPRGELMIRVELDTKCMFITVSSLRSWCANHRLPFVDMVKELEASGVVIGQTSTHMAEGTAIISPAVRAIILDMTKIAGVGL